MVFFSINCIKYMGSQGGVKWSKYSLPPLSGQKWGWTLIVRIKRVSGLRGRPKSNFIWNLGDFEWRITKLLYLYWNHDNTYSTFMTLILYRDKHEITQIDKKSNRIEEIGDRWLRLVLVLQSTDLKEIFRN